MLKGFEKYVKLWTVNYMEMKILKKILLAFLYTGCMLVSARELEKITWDNMNNWVQEVGTPRLKLTLPKDKPKRLSVRILTSEKGRQLWKMHSRSVLTKDEILTCKFSIRSDKPGTIFITGYQAGGKWTGLKQPGNNFFKVNSEWKKIVWTVKNTTDGTRDLRLPAINLDSFPKGAVIEIGEVTISTNAPNPLDVKYPNRVVFSANDEWRPINMEKLYIVPGSALDFSSLVDINAPCGVHGRMIANKYGHLALEKQPEKSVKLIADSFTPNESNLNISKEKIEAFAEGLRRQGYNAVRFHGINGYLMSRHRWDGKFYDDPETIPFIIKHEDNFHYLLAQLKKRGIYVMLDLAVWQSGWTTTDIWGGGPESFAYHLIAGTKEYRDNYRAGVLRMLRARNKYTGLTLAEDPTIAIILFYNEENIRFAGLNKKEMEKVFRKRWTAFLKKRYGSLEKLRKAWKGTDISSEVTWEKLPCLNGPDAQKNNEFACDMGRFIAEIEIETTQWFKSIMKEAQYNGLTTQWDFIFRLSETGPRASTDCVAMHAYHDHPSNWIASGSSMSQTSTETGFLRLMAPMRMLDRPFLASEYGIVYWNKYRHEQGISCGSFAAHQDWDLLCVHARPVIDKGGFILPFAVGSDPVIRASELEVQCLFGRGDVKPAKNTILFPLDDKFIFNGNRPFSAFNGNLSYLALLTKIGVSYGREHAKIKANLTLPPEGGATFYDFGMYGTIGDAGGGRNLFSDAVKKMRSNKLLPAGNKTDLAKGIYQSDTNEILMESAYNSITINTPRFSGITVKKNLPLPKKAGVLTVERAEFPASISVTTRDASKALLQSKKLLLLISTNAVNSGSSFTDNTCKTLVSIGKPPVLYHCGKFAVRIKSSIQKPTVYALNMNGTRSEELAATYKNGEIFFDVNVRNLKNPTPFFEITED